MTQWNKLKLSQVEFLYISLDSYMKYRQISGVWFDTGKKSWRMGIGPECPFDLEDKAPWTSWMFNFGGFTDSPHPRKQETRGLDTIQATSFVTWWLLLFYQEMFWDKGRFVKNPEIRKNTCLRHLLPQIDQADKPMYLFTNSCYEWFKSFFNLVLVGSCPSTLLAPTTYHHINKKRHKQRA